MSDIHERLYVREGDKAEVQTQKLNSGLIKRCGVIKDVSQMWIIWLTGD